MSTQETRVLDGLVPEDKRDESTAHLTLPSLPQEAGVRPDGVVIQEGRVAQALGDRERALDPALPTPDPPPTKAEAGEDTREIVVTTDEKTQTQEVTTVANKDVDHEAEDKRKREEDARIEQERQRRIRNPHTSDKTEAQHESGSHSEPIP